MAGVQRALLLVHVMAAVAQLVLVTSRQLLQLAIGHQRVAIGEGQVAIGAAQGPIDAVDAVDAADRGVSRDLVDGMAVVAVVLDRGARAARAAQRGGNCWKIEPGNNDRKRGCWRPEAGDVGGCDLYLPQFIPEKSVGPVYGRVGLHVVSEVRVQVSLRHVSEDEDDGAAAGLEDVVQGGPDNEARLAYCLSRI